MAEKTEFDFGELRSVLQQPPSAAAWEALCALVMPLRWERASEAWLPYAQAHLDREWPDDLRVLPAAALKRKITPSVVKLVRAVHATDHYSTEWRGLLDVLDAAQPRLTRLSAWQGLPPSGRELERLTAHMEQLTHLYSSLGVDKEATLIEALGTAGGQATLTTLCFDSTKEASFEPLRALLADAPRLRDLSLRLPYVKQAGALVDLLPAAQLEALSIQRTRLSPTIANRLIAHAWPKLHTLDLRGTGIKPAALARLYANMPALRHLYAAADSSSGEALDALRDAPWVLESLSLHDGSWIAPAAIAAALRVPCAGALRELDLGGALLNAQSVEAFARGPMSATLERLDLSETRTSGDPWGPLAGATLPNLRTLDLSLTTMSDALAHALLQLDAPKLDALILPTRARELSDKLLASTPLARFLDAPRAPTAPSRERRLTLPPDHLPLHPNA